MPVINGTDNADTLGGTGADDTILAGLGSDTILASGGTDSVDGGGGLDRIVFSDLSTSTAFSRGSGANVTTGSGTTTLTSVEIARFADGAIYLGEYFGPRDTIQGSEGSDTLTASRGNDVVQGLGGDDVLIAIQESNGGRRFHTLDGGTGNDLFVIPNEFFAGEQNNSIVGGAGSDTIDFSAIRDFNDPFIPGVRVRWLFIEGGPSNSFVATQYDLRTGQQQFNPQPLL